jgi:hypothetical protein
MANNSIAIYSNGITAFTRTFPVKKSDKATPISLPIRKKYIADVLGSLNIFGNVKLVEPPSFTPVNANKSSLEIQTDSVLDSLVTQLAGATVTVTTNDGKEISGTLMGKQISEQDNGTYKITAMAGGGFENATKAQAPLTDAAEVGDFTIWTGKDPISVKSQKSALVPRNCKRSLLCKKNWIR